MYVFDENYKPQDGWVNHYQYGSTRGWGACHMSREDADSASFVDILYRIHVKLKPDYKGK